MNTLLKHDLGLLHVLELELTLVILLILTLIVFQQKFMQTPDIHFYEYILILLYLILLFFIFFIPIFVVLHLAGFALKYWLSVGLSVVLVLLSFYPLGVFFSEHYKK